ncbi:MAG TPA: glycyl-radical enzyme activating protein [Candidatus Eisenbergiella merdigallinarum]|uniref:Glycyl-radical enzyme activating protein n=1 Tax=Candidatus Eisenbergiella merdigallinarum TaxID=2838552 RepID=A0A9D2SDQ5_9FIRM|nr:glycyl-radical enzyme activating protein [Candidatus Eisenbergiella merdigallinarum]
METEGTVFQIQRFCLRDGDGIRTSVFLKGCPLSCAWCHNPEGRSGRVQLSFLAHLCAGCGRCAAVCPAGVHGFAASHRVDYAKCTGCGRCVSACPRGCLELVGKRMTVSETVREALKDRPFWGTVGGVTFTGGEPLSQAGFVLECAKRIREAGGTVAVETSGFAERRDVEMLREVVDCWLYDFKAGEEEKHRRLCGCSCLPVRSNFRWLCGQGARLILRYPMIPGVNDGEADLDGLIRLLSETSLDIPVEILPYHRMGKTKAERIGESFPAFLPAEDAGRSQAEALCQRLRGMGVGNVRIS